MDSEAWRSLSEAIRRIRLDSVQSDSFAGLLK